MHKKNTRRPQALQDAKRQKTEDKEWWRCGKCGHSFSTKKGTKTKACNGCTAVYRPQEPANNRGTVHTRLPGAPTKLWGGGVNAHSLR